ncbi:putative beta-lysine N-acetyltransferase [Salipaludibacillus daqingensis]|uniref:putative beta-lysine N-acetyltransferase n=1 Tax=Salipaludibacillus daqingensis TaxID=3041001 RepID=UPI002476126C|nr:putative beta-lysine N-acetyltransferase [Salipaludibacillus daqingensis]
MNALKDHSFTISLFGSSILLEPTSKRLKVYKLPASEQMEPFIRSLKQLGKQHQCDKLIFYVKLSEQPMIHPYSTRYEGMIESFFDGEDAHIYAIFLDPQRGQTHLSEQEKNVFRLVHRKRGEGPTHRFQLPAGFHMRWGNKRDAQQMATLYKTVFKSYPTPMNDPEFIKQMMDDDVYFLIVQHNRDIVSACSAELLKKFRAAELSDCATYREHRSKQLLSYQVAHLFPKLKKVGVRTLFSYSRSKSAGMNLVNAKHGFHFGGRMIKNSNISGSIENMNIWYKTL